MNVRPVSWDFPPVGCALLGNGDEAEAGRLLVPGRVGTSGPAGLGDIPAVRASHGQPGVAVLLWPDR